MSRVTEITAITYTARLYAIHGARTALPARWSRRKKRQSRKSPIRRAAGRK